MVKRGLKACHPFLLLSPVALPQLHLPHPLPDLPTISPLGMLRHLVTRRGTKTFQTTTPPPPLDPHTSPNRPEVSDDYTLSPGLILLFIMHRFTHRLDPGC